MKKILFTALLAICFSLINSSDLSAGRKNKRTYNTEYSYNHHKGNIHPDKLPKSIKKYLKETYPGHYVMVSKRKGNGNYFVKIRYGGNQHRQYYRSLVFAHDGSVIKG